MKIQSVLAVAALVFAVNQTHATVAVYPFGYVFQESSGDPFSGELFLDQSSSSSGAKGDISPASFIDTPDFNFTLSQVPNLTVVGTFAWNSSQITSMDITGTYFFDGSEEMFTITAGGITETTFPIPDPGASGLWAGPNFVAGVPDTGSTALMLGLASGAIGMARRRFSRKAA